MYAERSIAAVCSELVRQKHFKRDFLADTAALELRPTDQGIGLVGIGETPLPVRQYAHRQIGTHLSIPAAYYDRMAVEAPELLCDNVNHWWQAREDRRLLRTLDGNVRAYLSDRYRPLDNFDVANHVLPALTEAGCELQTAEVTESKLYLKAVTHSTEMEVKKGDVVRAGICISNSEIGAGSLCVQPLIFRLVCLNGLILPDKAVKRHHVGRRLDGIGDWSEQYLSDEARQADDKAVWLKLRDTVKGILSEDVFRKIVGDLQESAQRKIAGNPIKAVEEVTSRFSLSEDESGSVLQHLIEGGDLSQYGLINAVTAASQDASSYDRASELEALGGQILELDDKDWSVVAAKY